MAFRMKRFTVSLRHIYIYIEINIRDSHFIELSLFIFLITRSLRSPLWQPDSRTLINDRKMVYRFVIFVATTTQVSPSSTFPAFLMWL